MGLGKKISEMADMARTSQTNSKMATQPVQSGPATSTGLKMGTGVSMPGSARIDRPEATHTGYMED